ncbi:diguanylate cyclase [Pseudomonas nitroreducens]|uniref:GGDEF domain-containing protein n=1 Tax=Pseudomonas nitroreducens TaxID=46680 RepID=UPI003F5CD79E
MGRGGAAAPRPEPCAAGPADEGHVLRTDPRQPARRAADLGRRAVDHPTAAATGLQRRAPVGTGNTGRAARHQDLVPRGRGHSPGAVDGRRAHAAEARPAQPGSPERRAHRSGQSPRPRRSLAALEQSGLSYAVLLLDIDHFKRVNDSWGHDAGDEALRRVAGVLRDSSRSEDLACRSGGEEFVLLLPGTNLEAARSIAERIRETVAGTLIPQVGKVTVSIGVAVGDRTSLSSDAVLKQADQRLYSAKQTGRNRVVSNDDA